MEVVSVKDSMKLAWVLFHLGLELGGIMGDRHCRGRHMGKDSLLGLQSVLPIKSYIASMI